MSKSVNLRSLVNTNKTQVKQRFKSALLTITCALAFLTPTQFVSPAISASKIEITVNKQAITNNDIKRRVALLRLQRTKGKLNERARKELVEEAIKLAELKRVRLVPDNSQVEAAFGRFASSNGLTPKRLASILNGAGVGANHFKDFVRVQLGWPRLVDLRFQGAGSSSRGMTTQDLVTKMLENKNDKPKTTEYVLQQVIFVVPKAKRSKSLLNKRTREANALRERYQSCDTTRSFAKGLVDVSVVSLGRFMKQELPPEWSDFIQKATPEKPTPTRVTDKGIEFVAVCKSRVISDDAAAEMVFRAEASANPSDNERSKKFLEELRERAVISYR